MAKFTDKNISCAECGTTFIWDAAEQAFFAKKGFKNTPTKCRACRAKKKITEELQKSKEKEVQCGICGKKGTLTSELSVGEEIFCFDCHVKQLAGPTEISLEDAQKEVA